MINTHTDGLNVPEENGGLGLLALADHVYRIPKHARRRTLIFLLATGHFQLPQFARGGNALNQAASRWIDMHPELLDGGVKKTVAALTVEHLGCQEWLDNAGHTAYGPTGLNEPGYCYTTTDAMKTIWLGSAKGTGNTRTIASAPNPPFYFGEGAPVRRSARRDEDTFGVPRQPRRPHRGARRRRHRPTDRRRARAPGAGATAAVSRARARRRPLAGGPLPPGCRSR